MKQYPDYQTLLALFDECLSIKYRHVENDASFAIKREGESVTIFFQASSGDLDWRNNFRFATRPYRKMGEVWYCHRGFLSVFLASLPYLTDTIMDESIKRFTVVGYSHGAAIALLCHEYVWFHRPDARVSLRGYGYGTPRVVCAPMPQSLLKRWENFTYIKNIDDLVTHLPPWIFGYRHVKEQLLIGQKGKYSMIDAHRAGSYRSELSLAGEKQRKELGVKV